MRAETFKQKWKAMNEITAREFIEELPEQAVAKLVTVMLAALAVLPVLVSFLHQMGLELAGQEGSAVDTLLIGNLWYQCIAPPAFVCGVTAVLRMVKSVYAGNGLRRPERGAVRERMLPVCLALMLAWSTVSAFLSDNYKNSFLGDGYRREGLMTYLIYACIFAAAAGLSERQMKLVAEVLVGACAVTGILAIAAQHEISVPFYLEDEKTLMFHNNNHYGYYLGLCVPLGMGLVTGEQGGWGRKLLRLLEFWLLCNAAAVNSVRGSFVGVAAAAVVWNLLIVCLHRENRKQLLLADLVLVGTVVWLNTGSELFERFKRIAEDLEEVKSGETDAADDIGSGRGKHWRYGIQFALERPLFGYGPDNLGAQFHAIDPGMTDRPHNELIQFAASLGFPAMALYVTGILSHWAGFLRRVKALSVFQLSLFACVGSYLVGSMFGNTMYYTTPYFYMVLGFSYQALRQAKQ